MSTISSAQNRLFQRPEDFSASFVLNSGIGDLLVVGEQTYDLDSTHFYLLSADANQNLSYIGGVHFDIPYGYLNHATAVPNGVIFCGANAGFLDLPNVFRMDTLGNVEWAVRSNSFPGGKTNFNRCMFQETVWNFLPGREI